MPVKFKVVELSNPQDRQAPKKFYPRAVSKGEISLRELARDIDDISTLSSTDVYAVLESLLVILPKHISQGNIVRLGDFGSFSLTITGVGADRAEKVTENSITGNKIVFRPGKELKKQLDAIDYKKEDEKKSL